MVAGPNGSQQLRAEQHDHLRGVAGRVGGADDPAAPGLGRRRRVARRRGLRQGGLGWRLPRPVARPARPARHAFVAQLVPAAGPARRRVHLGLTGAPASAVRTPHRRLAGHLGGVVGV